MKNKYYTPEIEEFHVGFEFEVNYGKDNWQKESLYAKPQIVTLPYMKLENIRVKYLDKEDIISLGFVKDPEWNENRKINIDHYVKDDVVIYLRNEDGELYPIDIFINERSYKFLRIKNKSELKKVLKMLGIDG